MPPTSARILTTILVLALLLRLGYALMQDPLAPFDRATGGDTWWYLEYGYRQVVDVQMEPLSTAPLYVMLVGGVRWLLQPETSETVLLAAPPGGGLDVISVPGVPVPAAVIVLRVLQALLGTATVYFVFRITRGLAGDDLPALIAAGVMAVGPAFVVNTTDIMTEPLFLFFLTAAVMVYVDVASDAPGVRRPVLLMALAGGLFGLATLTRAVVLLFPVGIALHAGLVMLANRRGGRPGALRVGGVVALLAVYVAVNAIWTGYYALRWDQFVVGAKGMTAFFYIGTQDDWAGPEAVDEALGLTPDDDGSISTDAEDYLAGANQAISANPVGYLQTRLLDLARAYTQPFGTTAFPGESIRAAVGRWLRAPTPGGLLDLLRTDAFFPKLAIYHVHYGGLLLGLVGMGYTRANWRVGLVLIGFIAYITLLHLLLDAIPRYIYPTLPFWWCFAAVPLARWVPGRG